MGGHLMALQKDSPSASLGGKKEKDEYQY